MIPLTILNRADYAKIQFFSKINIICYIISVMLIDCDIKVKIPEDIRLTRPNGAD